MSRALPDVKRCGFCGYLIPADRFDSHATKLCPSLPTGFHEAGETVIPETKPTASTLLPKLTRCRYCGCQIKKALLARHIAEKCPKRPSKSGKGNVGYRSVSRSTRNSENPMPRSRPKSRQHAKQPEVPAFVHRIREDGHKCETAKCSQSVSWEENFCQFCIQHRVQFHADALFIGSVGSTGCRGCGASAALIGEGLCRDCLGKGR